MAATTGLEQRMIVNPFGSESSPDYRPKSQKIYPISHIEDPAVKSVYQTYRCLIPNLRSTEDIDLIDRIGCDILTPTQIATLLQMVINNEREKKVNNRLTGLFFSKLIQDSYIAGNNDFHLMTQDTKIPWLCYSLQGKKYRRIRVSIDGKTGELLGGHSLYQDLYLNGDTEFNCYADAKNCSVKIEGKVGWGCGSWSRNCHHSIKGYADDRLGVNSRHCTYEVEGDVGEDAGKDSVQCKYYSTNPEAYKKMVLSVPKYRKPLWILQRKSHNKVFLMEKDKKVIEAGRS